MNIGTALFAAYWAQHASRLPAGYREVEYLEGNGAYIMTGVDGGVLGIAVEIEFMRIGFASYSPILNCYENEDTRATRIINTGGDSANMYFNCRTKAAVATTIIANKDLWHTVEMNQERAIVDGVMHTLRQAEPAQDISKEIQLLKGTYHDGVYQRVKYLRLYISDVQVRSFVPCVRTADSKPGMYDLCGSICPLTNSPFYVNSGTGADFLWGELG